MDDALRLAEALRCRHGVESFEGDAAATLRRQHAEIAELRAEVERLREALRIAEAALSDIGDADREPGDDVAWCEQRAAQAIPIARTALARKDDDHA